MRTDDTIFALSSGAPPAAIAVMRISGPAAGDTLRALAGKLPMPRRAVRRRLRDAAGETLDDALILWMPGPQTVTGEDIAELHLHGGRAVVAAVDRTLAGMSGLRAAEAGEFTRRALLGGRIDLSQTEGLANLLAADTESERRAALRSVEGGVGREVGAWLDRLTQIAAAIEAEIDYDDEVELTDRRDVTVALRTLGSEIETALARPSVERVRDGVRIVLAGPPNSGKSSLINALCQRDVAITSTIPGTTRDVIETTVVREGSVFILTDTAGLVDHSNDPIELLGVARGRKRIDDADLVLWLGDNDPPCNALWLYPRAAIRAAQTSDERSVVSVEWPASIEALWELILDHTRHFRPFDQQLFSARERAHLQAAMEQIRNASQEADLLIAAEAVRVARRVLSKVNGNDEVESVLDVLFAKFCVGK